ncbi:MAG: SRPBCC family protein [Phycisphaerales bacterium]|nr:SRPBCC family protein [Phycisphaerales bacterium]
MITIQRHGRGYLLETGVLLPRRREEIFPFFADARNLEELTPSYLRFEIVTPPPIEMAEGCIIDYRLKVHGIPLKWKTEITAWEPSERFKDEARRSPYRWWRHEHRFEERDGGTWCTDRVEYAVPGGPLIHTLFVKRDVRRIFEFRQQKLLALFGSTGETQAFGAEAAQALIS